MNSFIMKLSGCTPMELGAGFADCTLSVPVLAFDPRARDRIAATVHDGSGWNPTCMRVGKVH
ncbi:MAG TPA: hypothetical protein VGQ35_10370 [Dongiaceae bacterium]|nr:hypothetical protein [Dongiaceae bacterium]